MQITDYKIVVNNFEIQDDIICSSIEISNGVNKIQSASLIISNNNLKKRNELTELFKPGSDIYIELSNEFSTETVFIGVIYKINLRHSNNGSETIIECKHKTFELTKFRRTRFLKNIKDCELFSDILTQREIPHKIEDTKVVHSELTQYNVTDWDFIVTRADINGLIVVSDNDVLKIITPEFNESEHFHISLTEDMTYFDGEIKNSDSNYSLAYSSWNPAIQKNNNNTIGTEKQALIDEIHETSALIESDHLKQIINARLNKRRLSDKCGEFRIAGNPEINPGETVKLSDIGSEFDGYVIVNSVEHIVNDLHWETIVKFGLSDRWFSESNNIKSPEASGFKSPVSGLKIGIVVSLEDSQDCSKIKVELPSLYKGKNYIFARFSSNYSTYDGGILFPPNIGDEVVIGFIDNDPDNGIILGSLHNNNNQSKLKTEYTNNNKSIVVGNRLKLIFNKKNNKISIETSRDNKIEIDENKGEISLINKNDNIIKLNHNGILIKSKKGVKIESETSVNIKGNENTEIKSDDIVEISSSNISLNAEDSIDINSEGSSTLTANEVNTIKGELIKLN